MHLGYNAFISLVFIQFGQSQPVVFSWWGLFCLGGFFVIGDFGSWFGFGGLGWVFLTHTHKV